MMYNSFERVTDFFERKELQCSDCKRKTIHTLEARCTGLSHTDNIHGDADGWTHYSLFRCGACDAVCFLQESYYREHYDQDPDGNIYFVPDETQYPAPSSADFSFDTKYIPPELDELIEEMVHSLAARKLKLATVALRMIIEFITVDRKCKGRNLKQRIDDLLEKGIVGEDQHNLLHKIREKGNASAHDRVAMNRNEMVASIGLINLLLEKLYNGPAREADILEKANHAFQSERKPKF